MKSTIPSAGGIELRIFRVDVRLKRGKPPRHLLLHSLRRSRLPRGVAVVGTIRLLKHRRPGRATYIGLVAAFRSSKRAKVADEVPKTGYESFLGLGLAAKVTPREGFHVETRSGSREVQEVLVPDGFHLAYPKSLEYPPTLLPDKPKTPDTGAALLQTADSELQKLFSPADVFDDHHDFSWSVNGDTAPGHESDAQEAIIKDIEALLDRQDDVVTVTGDLEAKLDKVFPGVFPSGSLSAQQPPPGAAGTSTCRVSTDFTVSAPPYNGLDFKGPPFLAVPAAAYGIHTALTDIATGQAPGMNPWTGVTWKTSYEGRARSANPSVAQNEWEYVAELDGSGDPGQPTGPDRTWRYAVTYSLNSSACPSGATRIG